MTGLAGPDPARRWPSLRPRAGAAPAVGVLAGRADQRGRASVGDLADDETAGQAGRRLRVVGKAVLAAAEQDVSRRRALNARQEPAVGVEE